MAENIEDAGKKKKNKRNKPEACPRLPHNPSIIQSCHKNLIKDPEAALDMPSATIQGMMEPSLAYDLLLKRKEQCSTEKSQFMKLKDLIHSPSLAFILP